MLVSPLFFVLLDAVLGGSISRRQHNHPPASAGGSHSSKHYNVAGLISKLPPVLENLAVGWMGKGIDLVASETRKLVPHAPVKDVTTVPAKFRPDAQRRIARFGPFILQPQGAPKKPSLTSLLSMDAQSQSWLLRIKDGLCWNCTVLGAQGSINDESGKILYPADGVFLHHLCDTTDPTRAPFNTDVFNQWGNEFLVIGTERQGQFDRWTTADGKFASGFQINPLSELVFSVDVINNTKEKRDFYVTIEYEYLDGMVGGNTQTQLVDMGGCDKRPINISSAGPVETTSGKFRVQHDGTLVNAAGHLHDGGTKTSMYINDRLICTVNGVYGPSADNKPGTSSIIGMSTCDALPVSIKTGDYMHMVAEYDLKEHPQRGSKGGMIFGKEEAMGMWAFYFVPNPAASTRK